MGVVVVVLIFPSIHPTVETKETVRCTDATSTAVLSAVTLYKTRLFLSILFYDAFA